MFVHDLQIFVTKFQMMKPVDGKVSIAAKIILRCQGTESGGKVESNGYYDNGRWIETERYRADVVEDGNEEVPMWKKNVPPNQLVMIPATIWKGKEGKVFAKLDQSISRAYDKTYYHYRHLLYDRNGSMENIAVEGMLTALYNIVRGKFEQYNPLSATHNVSCINCKSHLYIGTRDEDDYGAPYRRAKSVQELREEGPSIPLHYCLARKEWVDEDCSEAFNRKHKLSPGTYVNEYNYLTGLPNGKILVYKPGIIRYNVACMREENHEPEVVEEDDTPFDTSMLADDEGEEEVISEDDEKEGQQNRIAGKLGSTYVIDDETTADKYDIEKQMPEILRQIEEAKYKEANPVPPAGDLNERLWCAKRGRKSMFEEPGLTNEVRELVTRAYPLDYSEYVLSELYQAAAACPHYCSSYRKTVTEVVRGKKVTETKWVNILYPDRAVVSIRGKKLNQLEIDKLADDDRNFRISLSKTEMIVIRR